MWGHMWGHLFFTPFGHLSTKIIQSWCLCVSFCLPLPTGHQAEENCMWTLEKISINLGMSGTSSDTGHRSRASTSWSALSIFASSWCCEGLMTALFSACAWKNKGLSSIFQKKNRTRGKKKRKKYLPVKSVHPLSSMLWNKFPAEPMLVRSRDYLPAVAKIFFLIFLKKLSLYSARNVWNKHTKVPVN